MTNRMPTFYIPHGAGPCFFMKSGAEKWQPMAQFLKGIAHQLPSEPKALLVISAHWLNSPCAVTSAQAPELLYDYYGFPAHTYELSYPASGDPALAARVLELLAKAGIQAQADAQRGLDHGVFIPLLLTYPDAQIPVVQLSLESRLNAAEHLKIGQGLSQLRDEGVLIIGSGMSFHNMRAYGNPEFTAVAERFDQWLSQTIEATPELRNKGLVNWQHAPGALESHPPQQEEHLLPLMVVAGAASAGVGKKVFCDYVLEVPISGFRFD